MSNLYVQHYLGSIPSISWGCRQWQLQEGQYPWDPFWCCWPRNRERNRLVIAIYFYLSKRYLTKTGQKSQCDKPPKVEQIKKQEETNKTIDTHVPFVMWVSWLTNTNINILYFRLYLLTYLLGIVIAEFRIRIKNKQT